MTEWRIQRAYTEGRRAEDRALRQPDSAGHHARTASPSVREMGIPVIEEPFTVRR